MIVEEGQLLAQLDVETLRPQLDLAERQLEARRAELAEVVVRRAEAEREQHRLERLKTESLSSEREVDKAQSEVAALQARFAALERAVDVAEATVRVSQQAIEDLEVRAPFAGVIVSKNAQPGEMVSPISAGGGFTRTGIGTIVDMDSLEIEVDVSENFINRVRPEQPVSAKLNAYPDWAIPARVIAIIPTADRAKATVKVRIGLDESDARILPEMGVRVAFLESPSEPTATEGSSAVHALVVPPDAVQTNGDTGVVFVINNGSVERRNVKLGERIAAGQIVLSGLSSGTRLAMSDLSRLADGTKVRIAD